MTFLLSLPMELRLGLLFVLGAVVGGQVNRGVYRLAWDSRDIGPWSAPPRDAPPRRWFDRVPIFGWLGLAREAALHGTGYWLRPLLIELFMGLGFAALYVWETGEHHVPWATGSAPVGVFALQAVLHAGFIAHLVLISLMAVATFIDLDEKTIPDEITVPGALAGLLFAAVLPASLLPVGIPAPASKPAAIGFLEITSPQMTVQTNWPDWLNGPYGLAIALVCFAAWCFAILPRTWWTRSGPLKTVQYLIASIIRQRVSLWILAMLIAGGLGIACVWGLSPSGSWRWQALLSALVGMVFGGGLIWMVRAIGSRVLAKEAMGFGDVTLMAMIGAFVGWQPSLIIFFLAPIAGLVIALTQWVLTGRKDIAYGPFLCLATLVLLVGWGPIWNRWGWPAFQMGWLIVAMLFVCLLLMGAMLAAWRAVSR